MSGDGAGGYCEEVIRQAFEAYDTDGSGFIEVEEMKKACVERLELKEELADRVCEVILQELSF